MDLLQKQAELKGDMRPKFADASKVLRQPDAFEVDDPIKFSLWREQFLNWLCFSDSRYGDLVKLAEESLDNVDENEFNEETKDLSQRLYSILASYLRGPAAQIVRSFQKQRNGFGVWQRLKQLYAPKTRPRTLALGQTIMQYPAFGGGKSVMEHLLNFDAVLEQYALASGKPMPDDRNPQASTVQHGRQHDLPAVEGKAHPAGQEHEVMVRRGTPEELPNAARQQWQQRQWWTSAYGGGQCLLQLWQGQRKERQRQRKEGLECLEFHGFRLWQEWQKQR